MKVKWKGTDQTNSLWTWTTYLYVDAFGPGIQKSGFLSFMFVHDNPIHATYYAHYVSGHYVIISHASKGSIQQTNLTLKQQ